LVVVAAVLQARSGLLSARLIAGAGLLFAYECAFIPGPPLNARLSDIYAMARQGWRAPWSAKIINAAAFVLLVSGIYLQLHRR
jgi:hypothetical protein